MTNGRLRRWLKLVALIVDSQGSLHYSTEELRKQ
jgi:hypothetical protein